MYFRYANTNNAYYVSLNPASGIALKKVAAGAYSELQANTAYPVLVGKEYRIKVAANGGSIEVYIDGKKELSATDTSISSGKIALWTNNASALYDDIVVKQ